MFWLLIGFQPFARAIRHGMRDPEFRALLVMVAFTLLVGTAFYHQAEGWSFLNAFYFSAITLTTVGYGDLHPTTDVAKIFTVIYIFTGIGLLVAFAERMAHNLIAVRTQSVEKLRKSRQQQTPEQPET